MLASYGQGVSLASRSAGIADPNLPGSGADGLTAGQTLNLNAKVAANHYLQCSLIGDQFPLISGDRIRFSTAGGGVLTGRDYWVFNRNAFTGTF